MKLDRVPRRCTGGLGLFAGAVLSFAALPAQAQDQPPQPAYLVFDTGTLGGTFAFGSGINNVGWVAGGSNNSAGALHAAESIPGNVVDLGTLGGTNSAVEWPIKNDYGVVVGISQGAAQDPLGEPFSCADFIPGTGQSCLPFIWTQAAGMTQLPLLGGNNGFATGVNNRGQAVGWAETGVHDKTCILPEVLQFLAVEWGPAPGAKQVLPPWPGNASEPPDTTSAATAINDSGQVVGISGDCGNAVGAFSARHALLWQNGRPLRLPTLGGAGWNTPMSINQRGDSVGFSDTPGDDVNGVLTANNQATLWPREGGIVNLHTLPNDATAQATGINDHGEIVGTSIGPNNSTFRVFVVLNGRMYDLNTLIAPDSPLYLVGSGDINDRGEITGQACVLASGCAVLHTFVAIPLPGGAPEGWQGADGGRAAVYPQGEAREQLMRRMHLGRTASAAAR